MKYLKYALGLIALLVLVFFAAGLIQPSITYDNAIVVQKPLAEAWAVLGDESKLPQWLPGFQRIEAVSGTPGHVGAVSKIYFEENGQEMVMQETITEVTPNQRMSMTFDADFMVMAYTMTLEEKDGYTALASTSQVRGNGVFARSMVAMMKGAMKDQEDQNMAALKAVIDENTTDYGATAQEAEAEADVHAPDDGVGQPADDGAGEPPAAP